MLKKSSRVVRMSKIVKVFASRAMSTTRCVTSSNFKLPSSINFWILPGVPSETRATVFLRKNVCSSSFLCFAKNWPTFSPRFLNSSVALMNEAAQVRNATLQMKGAGLIDDELANVDRAVG